MHLKIKIKTVHYCIKHVKDVILLFTHTKINIIKVLYGHFVTHDFERIGCGQGRLVCRSPQGHQFGTYWLEYYLYQ